MIMKYLFAVLSAVILTGCAYHAYPVVKPVPSPFVIPGERPLRHQ